MSGETILSVDRLSMRFGGIVAVNDLTFNAERRKITALITVSQIACGIVGAVKQGNAFEPEFGEIDGAFLGDAPGRRADQAEERQAGGPHQRVVLRHHQVFQHGHAGKQADVLKGARHPCLF